MFDLQHGWRLEADQGPEWMFFRLVSDAPRSMEEPPVAETIAEAAKAAGIKRVVLELGDGVILFSFLVGQMVQLHKRFLIEGGAFRICGLTKENANVLRTLRLADRLPNYRDREAAVMGRLP
jgi:anti-anti-sigma regulatory factor